MFERPTPWTAVPRQDGRRYVVTGANSGVGLATVRILVSRGAEVVMAVRSRERGETAADRLSETARRGGGSVEVRVLDVADLTSVRAFAEGVHRLDVLINNAGVLGIPFSRSPDGVELQLATNHLGHFALANLLLPGLSDRVVVVGSHSHRGGDLDVEDLDWSRRGYRPYAAYAQSKLANLLFLAELQRRLTATGSTLRATGAHPGNTATAITTNTGNGLASRVGSVGQRLVGMPAWRGALPIAYAATMDLPGNTYVGPHGRFEMRGWPAPVGRSRTASDPDLATALWAVSEELSGVRFPL